MDIKNTKTIAVDYLARVEGEGGLFVKIKNNNIDEVKLKIFEPPRFFESLLIGRHFSEVIDITARICGICPVAYQVSSVKAIENAFGIDTCLNLNLLRRLMYCGEWIESHTLHIYLLHAPDFLGYPDAISMAKKFSNEVNRGLRMKKAGNKIIKTIGGREIHPINIKVGGFHKIIEKQQLNSLLDELYWARDAAIETILWVANFNFPDHEYHYEFVSLSHQDNYPIEEGRITSNKGLSIDDKDFFTYFEEYQVEYSTALHSRIKERGSYITGPLARYANNANKFSVLVKEVINDINFPLICYNFFKSIIVRSLEVLYAFDEAIRIIKNYNIFDNSIYQFKEKESQGFGVSEAPRGMLFNHYKIDKNELINFASIIPPTSQNQKCIEQELFLVLKNNIDKDEKFLTEICEKTIRNHDPCISCSAHFLKMHINNI